MRSVSSWPHSSSGSFLYHVPKGLCVYSPGVGAEPSHIVSVPGACPHWQHWLHSCSHSSSCGHHRCNLWSLWSNTFLFIEATLWFTTLMGTVFPMPSTPHRSLVSLVFSWGIWAPLTALGAHHRLRLQGLCCSQVSGEPRTTKHGRWPQGAQVSVGHRFSHALWIIYSLSTLKTSCLGICYTLCTSNTGEIGAY